MKKINLLLLGLTASITYSQDCKYKRNEVDEFTKHKILETKEGIFTISGMGLGFSVGYSLLKINDQRILKFNVVSPSIFTLQKGSEIMFKTDAENTINLIFPESVIANGLYNNALKATHWSGSIQIYLTEENYQRLLNEKLLKLRIYTSAGYIDDDINTKRDNKFKEQLKCIK